MSEKIKDVFFAPIACDISFFFIGQSICLPCHSVGPEVRENYVLHFVKSGKGLFIHKGIKYKMGRGNFFLLTPEVENEYIADEEDPWHYCWISFTGNNLNSIFEIINIDPKFPMGKVKKVTLLEEYFENLLHSEKLLEQNPLSLQASLLKLLALFETDKYSSRNNIVNTSDNYPDVIHKFYKIVTNPDNFKNLTVESLTNELGVSRNYLNNLVHKEMNMSTKEYIQKKKIQRACFLLESTKLPISEIAYLLGFNYASSFSRAFSAEMNISPALYQKEYLYSAKDNKYWIKEL